ncbi:hypothetical protein KTQ42_23180 [Noviherbaspirillum sp. L7-7A]|uniref:hypothetical protein n=1 Tax=Noviherbaspirillum sp. L7-7A TaxID=2850560 RepID=UPI001C2C4978|nr:hypothetical protein [Noviherbaspirillum sp. L7-7A]MBV0882182.1 hypothetical protein [Noviherbaspirillum sp. L7-7A]
MEIDAAGSYVGDVCGIYPSNLTIRGVNGRPKIDGGGRNAMGKGIWVLSGNNTSIENVEMFGARVNDRNGAALRLDGQHLTLRGSYLHHNENGILTNNDGVSNVTIETTEFAYNGYGDGYSHNLYIGHINSLIFRASYSHDANIGHNLKSRANTNTVVNSRFSSTSGQPSYEVDFPNGGTTYLIGNVIHQPANNQNPALVAYGEEGATNSGQDLYVVNNTFLNDDSSRGTFIMVGGSVGTPVLMQNNVFSGTGNVNTQSSAIDKTNYRSVAAAFVDRANFDLHPAAVSPMVDAGSVPGISAGGLSLKPSFQYKHVAGNEARPVNGQIDIGAYEVEPVTSTVKMPDPTSTTTTPPVTSPSPSVNWIECATEGGTCTFSGTRQVRYGAGGTYAYKSGSGYLACNNGVFGDPAYGLTKTCAYAQSSTTTSSPTPPTTTAPALPVWTACASENGTCTFSGTAQVRYGANNSFAYQTAIGSIGCNNGTFGDPAFGLTKTCEYESTSGTTPTTPQPVIAPTVWTWCAGEGGTCSFSGTHQVRYGANGSFAYKSATGAIACNNGAFGDPAYGATKWCEYAN